MMHVTNRFFKLASFLYHTLRVIPAEAGIQYRGTGFQPVRMGRMPMPHNIRKRNSETQNTELLTAHNPKSADDVTESRFAPAASRRPAV